MDAFYGEIRAFGFNFAPMYWAYCWGQSVNTMQYQALYSIIGHQYGGSGQTFSLPDLRGRAPMNCGTGAGGVSATVAQAVGTPTVTLTQAQLAYHNHDAKGVQVLAGQTLTNAPSATAYPSLTRYLATNTNYDSWTTNTPTTALHAAAVGMAGGNATGATDPHPNVSPYQAVNFCICLEGAVYPIRP